MFVIIERNWIEDFYETESLFENVLYTTKESAKRHLKEMHESFENAFFYTDKDGQEWLIDYTRYSYQNPDDDIEVFETDGIPWYRIQELKLEGVK